MRLVLVGGSFRRVSGDIECRMQNAECRVQSAEHNAAIDTHRSSFHLDVGCSMLDVLRGAEGQRGRGAEEWACISALMMRGGRERLPHCRRCGGAEWLGCPSAVGLEVKYCGARVKTS